MKPKSKYEYEGPTGQIHQKAYEEIQEELRNKAKLIQEATDVLKRAYGYYSQKEYEMSYRCFNELQDIESKVRAKVVPIMVDKNNLRSYSYARLGEYFSERVKKASKSLVGEKNMNFGTFVSQTCADLGVDKIKELGNAFRELKQHYYNSYPNAQNYVNAFMEENRR